jgi:hypothetical protein
MKAFQNASPEGGPGVTKIAVSMTSNQCAPTRQMSGTSELRETMAKIVQVHNSMGTDDTTFAAVLGTPEGGWDPTFDSYLTKNAGRNENLRLKIVLRVWLKPDLPTWEMDTVTRQIAWVRHKILLDRNRRYGGRYDHNKNTEYRFPTMSWAPVEWQVFVGAFVQRASVWNRKFCLVPPPYFNLFDFKNGQYTLRPNIACEFELAVVGEKGHPHQMVEVINLYHSDHAFRSDAGHMTSHDRGMERNSSVDPAGLQHNDSNQSTVAHEVGHLLGLPHIGQSKDLANCQLAILLGEQLEQEVIPAIWKGGFGARVCYGDRSSASDANNIMGMGDQFGPENAEPWRSRMVNHMRVPADLRDWRMEIGEVRPQLVK